MKKGLLVVLVALTAIFLLTIGGSLTAYAELTDVSVDVEKDGSVNIVINGDFGENDWAGIYLAGESPDPNAGGEISIVWWYLNDDGCELNYADDAPGVFQYNVERADVFCESGANSPLKPGDYCLMVMSNDGYTFVDGFEEAINFTVPDLSAPATEQAATEVPAVTDEPAPTEVSATDAPAATDVPATATPEPAATESAATELPATDAPAATDVNAASADPAATSSPSDNGGNDANNASAKSGLSAGEIAAIVATALVVVCVAIIVAVYMKKKKARK